MIAQLRRDYSATTDFAERQRIHDQLEDLEKEKLPATDETRIAEIRDRIAKIRRENSLRTDAKRREIELKNQQELSKVQETRFTGVFSWVEIKGM